MEIRSYSGLTLTRWDLSQKVCVRFTRKMCTNCGFFQAISIHPAILMATIVFRLREDEGSEDVHRPHCSGL